MLLARDWIKKKYPGHRSQHTVEKGDDGQHELSRLTSLTDWGVSIVPKIDPDTGMRLRPFEAADLVAWETKRFYDDLNAQPRRVRMRQSNRRLNEMLSFGGGQINVESMCVQYPQFYPPRTTEP